MKKKMKINQLDEMVNDEFEVLMINHTIIVSRLGESMLHINYKMNQSIYLSMDLEIKSKGLCSMKCITTYDCMKKWDDLILRKKRRDCNSL